MRLGYPCINRTLECKASSTFRLSSYSKERLKSTVENNLDCLMEILKFNRENGLMFFRISSDTVPFASHPVCDFDWTKHFEEKLRRIGSFIKENNFRISMHPNQFILLISPKDDVTERSIAELRYHTDLLKAMDLDLTARIQLHIGGKYGDKERAIDRFVERYENLPQKIRKRIVIENDDSLYSLKDCLKVNEKCSAPILFDSFHHECFNNGEDLNKAIKLAGETWD